MYDQEKKVEWENNARKVFLCFPDNLDHLRFYSNQRRGLLAHNVELYFMTVDVAVYEEMRSRKLENAFLIKRDTNPWHEAELHFSREVITQQISAKDAGILYASVYNAVANFHKQHRLDFIYFGGGSRVLELAACQYANENNIPKAYFELANIKGKAFLDKQGVNAKSWLYEHMEKLDSYHFTNEEYEVWRDRYLSDNFKSHVVKQAVSYTHLKWKYGLLSRLGFLRTGLKIRELDLLKKLRSFLTAKFGKQIIFDNVDLVNTKYYFFPMQVSNDMQIVLNSDIGIFEGLAKAVELAQVAGLPLVVKLHPAEPYLSVIEHLLKLRKQYGFKLVKDNTFDVIANAAKVITINSTVGLEAMILGRPVKFLGRSFYKDLDKERLKNYIMGYLLDLDIFSEKEFTDEQISYLLNRLELM